VTLIEEGNKSFLWGCKCRSGKTYMIGGINNKQFKLKNKLNVLLLHLHQQKHHHNLQMIYSINLKILKNLKFIILKVQI
jgi:hypothetical protein